MNVAPAGPAPCKRNPQPRFAALQPAWPPQIQAAGSQHQHPHGGHLDDQVAGAPARSDGSGWESGAIGMSPSGDSERVGPSLPNSRYLIRPAHEPVEFVPLTQIPAGVRIDEHLGDVSFTGRRCSVRHEVDAGRAVGCRRGMRRRYETRPGLAAGLGAAWSSPTPGTAGRHGQPRLSHRSSGWGTGSPARCTPAPGERAQRTDPSTAARSSQDGGVTAALWRFDGRHG